MRRRAAAALTAPLSVVVLAVSGCGAIPEDWRTPAFLDSGEAELDERLPTVEGTVGEEPKVSFPDIAPPKEQVSGVVAQGETEGELVRPDDLVEADIVDYQWTAKGEAEQTQSTYETGTPLLLQLEQMGDELAGEMVDQSVGSRIVYVMPSPDPAQAQQAGQPSPEPGSVVSIVDIVDRHGKGDTVPGKQSSDGGGDLPTVTDTGDGEPTIEIPDTDPPEKLRSERLIEGEGPKVGEGQQLVVQYTGMTWSDGEIFDSTWQREGKPTTFPIGVGQVIEGWDEGLVGERVGSRVLLTIPEDLAYGEEAAENDQPAGTLVFVVDILDAIDPPPQQPSGSGGSEENPAEDAE